MTKPIDPELPLFDAPQQGKQDENGAAREAGGAVAWERRAQFLPWVIAAAALAFATIGWWPRAAELPVAQQHAALLAAGVAPLAWTVTEDPAAAGASGDVVWDARAQRGVMRFVGLAVNEPTRFQYQLWINDAARDERYPVDGGVFDIRAGSGEVLIPIRANLPIGNAGLFAVTVEAPGGVVVSSRERTVLIAAPR